MSPLLLEHKTQARRRQLRHFLRASRRSLSKHEQILASHRLLKVLLAHKILARPQNIALYMPTDGEINPYWVANWCRKYKKNLYLPHIRKLKPGFLWFLPWQDSSPLKKNPYGLLEPDLKHLPASSPRLFAVWCLDMIFLPLVGFDTHGNRLGMGGGFYDRTLGACPWKKPQLIGLAHQCQRVDELPAAPWDIPLDGICTDQHFYAC